MKQKQWNRHIDLQRRLVRSERSPISTWPLKCRENLLGQPTKRCSSVSVCMYLGDSPGEKIQKAWFFFGEFLTWHMALLLLENYFWSIIITAYCFLDITWLLLCLSSFPIHFVICSSIRLLRKPRTEDSWLRTWFYPQRPTSHWRCRRAFWMGKVEVPMSRVHGLHGFSSSQDNPKGLAKGSERSLKPAKEAFKVPWDFHSLWGYELLRLVVHHFDIIF